MGDNTQGENTRGGRRGRGGRGAGNAGGRGGANALNAADLAARFTQSTPAGASAAPVAKDKPQVDEEEDGDAEVCFICASPVVHIAVTSCNHRTCHICALRMRALYKTKDCAHCRVSLLNYSFRAKADIGTDGITVCHLY
jgi:hypothetical protein